MKSLASLSLLILTGTAPVAAQEPPPGDGPRGSSQLGAGEVRYDAVGYVGANDLAGVSVASGALPVGSYAEVTALDSGRTIIVAVTDGDIAPGRIATLSGGAAAALGLVGSDIPVRIRKVTPTPQDVAQLQTSRTAPSRPSAPPALLVALRKKLSPIQTEPSSRSAQRAARTSRPAPVAKLPAAAAKPAPPRAAKTATSGYVVQVAAFSNGAAAAAVAKAIGGSVIAGPPLWRVRLGPYPDAAAAARARADAARKGYPGGQITRLP